MTFFLGREGDIAAIRALLDAGDTRLVTLTGPGGIGKTRIAVEVASQLAPDFAHGMTPVWLASVRDSDLVPVSVAQALGITPGGDLSIDETLFAFLRERHTLLLLDNLEHLVDGVAPWLADLLARCPRLKVLATSRAPLRIAGEQQFPVEPLGVPESDCEITVDIADESAAVRLFVERASAVRPDIALDDTTASDVAGICRALDAAEALEEAGTSVPAIDVVTSLVDQSLIHLVPTKTGAARFRMLEVIREFGLDRLDRHGEMVAARDAHAAWCLDLASRADSGIDSSEQIAWLGRLDAELDNIRGALAWLRERERIGAAQDLAGWMGAFLALRGLYTEARAAGEALVAHPLGAAPTMGRAGTLTGLGGVALRQGDAPRAIEALDEAVAIYRQLEAGRQLVRALVRRGYALVLVGRSDDAYADCMEAIELAKGTGDRLGEAQARSHLGLVFLQRGELEEAQVQMQAGVDLCRATGESRMLSINLGNLAMLARRRGELELAASYMEEASHLAARVGDRRNRTATLLRHAEIDRVHGEPDLAESHLREALTIAIELSDPFHIGYALVALGSLATAAGEIDRAMPLLREAMSHLERLGSPGGIGLCLDAIADVAILSGEPPLAARWIGATDAAQAEAGIARNELTPGEHAARVAAITAALGEDDYRRAWEAGQALSLDEAVAEALAWEPPLDTAPSPPASPVAVGPGGQLSPRELEVLRLMAEGLTNQEVAEVLFISRRTATSHASTILGKLGVPSRTAAVAYAIRNGLA